MIRILLLLGRLCLFLVILIISFFIVVYMTFPCPIQPNYVELPDPPVLEGVLAKNDYLNKTQFLYEGKMKGPEAIVVHDDILYTGTSDGKILKIHSGKVEVLARMGTGACDGAIDEEQCGRPLGMRMMDGNQFLLVADAYKGLFKVNIVDGVKTEVLSSSRVVDGSSLTFMNDLDVSRDGVLYFTHVSSSHGMDDMATLLAECPSDGRLLSYNPQTDSLKVLMDDIPFANGVQLSPQEDFVLVASITTASIFRYYLKGEKAGSYDLFAVNLPGQPDNIRPSSRDGVWVALPMIRHSGMFNALDFLARWPFVRTLMCQLLPLGKLAKSADQLPTHTMAIRLDWAGHIAESLQHSTISFPYAITHIADVGDALYFGSFVSSHIAKLDIDN